MTKNTNLPRWLLKPMHLGCLLILCQAASALAGPREQALQIHNRLAAVPPSQEVLLEMSELIANGQVRAAVRTAMDTETFYSITLKDMATPWTNRDQNQFAALNDYTATFIGLVIDGADIRTLLYDDVIYVSTANGLPPHSNSNNAHYEAIEQQGISLRDTLDGRTQSSVTGLPSEATAGVMTSRAGARAFFYAGTNRAMFRFTLLNHLCRDLEQVHDAAPPPDRIRQDVSRSPGGDSRVFLNNCMGCHNGMDPMAQAYAYYEWQYDPDSDPEGGAGHLTYNRDGDTDPQTGTRVVAKYHINANTFRYGYATPDDSWENYWRDGANAALGWDDSLEGRGQGAKTMGRELAHSDAFASCQVEKVFRKVCLRRPANAEDRELLGLATQEFKANDYNLRTVFEETAIHCMGD
ncbi:hypothetical protein [Marinimicrobium sp. ABcell2]|uniref:hypothetical protein n=1 Tax=Marinimicrobium sp. ABcell2 TaxID=3069751 RepID=UPI0027B7E058|nr:hypothetical protein [Marinimicrobium sp. ABcell2]MDQ2076628.1 hypothetical protein [Marinimicrobium sp. ABcell2]